jgi:hypothetical protein
MTVKLKNLFGAKYNSILLGRFAVPEKGAYTQTALWPIKSNWLKRRSIKSNWIKK